ncbi:hypothetical protein [Paenibacillus chungangensis]|uniref:Uncharacterized protein n=1 Tax=Paenibacillus chungangensis TaxID=696535 RepID=A0ABW3HTT9_9BACL
MRAMEPENKEASRQEKVKMKVVKLNGRLQRDGRIQSSVYDELRAPYLSIIQAEKDGYDYENGTSRYIAGSGGEDAASSIWLQRV